MKKITKLAVLFLLGTFSLVGEGLYAQEAKRVPVLIELFTSEGCNTCPPADKLLQKLANEQPIDGVEIIPLQEHVDYWNRFGWTDPFSSPEFSKRQGYYAAFFKYSEIFTPNFIVDGTNELRGNSGNKPIIEASKVSKGNVEISLKNKVDQKLSVSVAVTNLPTADPGERVVLVLAVTENNLTSKVLAGENKGSTFKHMAVTRYLEPIGMIKENRATISTDIPIANNWKLDDLTVVAFVQHIETRRIVAAGRLTLKK